jgi:lipid-A-disaccharide synthase
MLASAAQLSSSTIQFVLPVASSLDDAWVQEQLQGSPVAVALVPDARAALLHSHAGIIASGTATVEAALIGTPFVMIYRVSPLTYTMGRRFVKLSRFAMVNVIAGRDVVPEFVQHDFIPEHVAAAVHALMADGSTREDIIRGLAEVRNLLHSSGQISATDRAAQAILSSLAG